MAENPGAGQGPEKSLPARLSVPMLTDAHRRSQTLGGGRTALPTEPLGSKLQAGTARLAGPLQGPQVPEGHRLHAAYTLVWF